MAVLLLELEDIIVSVGREPNDANEAAQWMYYIESVSAFINSYVSTSFEVISGDVKRYQADYHGQIHLGGDPVSTVTSVKDWQSQSDVSYIFNGIDLLFNLYPNQVVDVTYTHGYATVPDEIKYMAVEAVNGVLGLGAPGQITSFTVGDVTEVYRSNRGEGPTATVVSLSKETLDQYVDEHNSMVLGNRPQPSAASNLPLL